MWLCININPAARSTIKELQRAKLCRIAAIHDDRFSRLPAGPQTLILEKP